VSTSDTHNTPRPLYAIAADIMADWGKINYAAKPYLEAMADLDTIDSMYGLDTAKSVVVYFLSNAQCWRGQKAREIKLELKSILKGLSKGAKNDTFKS